jgi:hypothetical protein
MVRVSDASAFAGAAENCVAKTAKTVMIASTNLWFSEVNFISFHLSIELRQF